MKRIFLLGGHDLEMLEIKKLLEREGYRLGKDCFDAGLRWDNADLRAYKEVLEQHPDGEFVGIELRDADGLTPKNYTLIDHHNALSHRPAAIFQVAKLLRVEPDERMRIVAANDASYIPAMKAMGVSDETIAQIRLEDRRAQGVTDEDEHKAEISIADHMETIRDTFIVKSLTPHFSTICDRLFPYRRLLIYTDSEWVFYGEGKGELVKMLAEDIASKKVYHGGGDNGYIGAAKGAFPPQQIVSFVNTIHQRYEQI